MDTNKAKTFAATNEEDDDDEWVVFNDDGFVYKRRKRSTVDPPPPQRPPLQNQEAEEDERRWVERKARLLLKLKSEYQREISYWELLSNNVRAMEDEAREAREQEEATTTSLLCVENVGGETERSSGSVLDELQKQVEAQEAIIHEMSCLCDTADEICNAQEEVFKKSGFDLPIWGSPRRLMKSLCDE